MTILFVLANLQFPCNAKPDRAILLAIPIHEPCQMLLQIRRQGKQNKTRKRGSSELRTGTVR